MFMAGSRLHAFGTGIPDPGVTAENPDSKKKGKQTQRHWRKPEQDPVTNPECGHKKTSPNDRAGF